MEINKYYVDLVTQNPINYDGLIIYQPSFNDIKKVGIDFYNQIMLVYSLTLDCFNDIPDDGTINIFNDLILNDQHLLSCLSESLYILCKSDEITLFKSENKIQLKFIDIKYETIEKEVEKDINIFKSFIKKVLCFILRKEYKQSKRIVKEDIEVKNERFFNIDSNNFDNISEIILKINGNKKMVIEKPPTNLSQKQRDIWEKLREGRNRDAQKNEVHIYDILNICEYCGNYRIPIEEITKMSLWRIMNCYKSRLNIKSYDDNLQIALVSGDGKSISGENHWHHQLMIRE